MADYSGVVARAKAMIAKKGALAVFSRQTGQTKDPVSQSVSVSGKPETTERMAVSVGVGNSWSLRGNSLVGVRSDSILLVPEGYEPVKDDVVLWGGNQWKVTDLQDIGPAGESLVLTVLLTR